MIYDFGGGTLDVAIIKFENNRIRVLAYTGNPFLGGQDIDNLILQYLLNEYKEGYKEENNGKEPVIKPQVLARFKE